MSDQIFTVTTLPDAGRKGQLARWGISRDRVGGRPQTAIPDLQQGAEPPRPVRRAGNIERAQMGAKLGDGWDYATPGADYGVGLTAHRGVLHPDDYVDTNVVQEAVLERLGFSLDEVRSVYRQGPLSSAQRELRARIDARLMEIAEDGGLMKELGRALGWAVKANGTCQTLSNALARAREAA